MSFEIVYYLTLGASLLIVVGLYLRSRKKRLAEKPKEPPRWHNGFDDVL